MRFKAGLMSLAGLALLAAGCASYDERQAALHEVVLYWQGANTEYVDRNGEKVKVDRLPIENGRHEMRLRHLCSDCAMDNQERLQIVHAVASDIMTTTCPNGHTVLEEEHTVEPMGQKRNYRALASGIRRYAFRCTG